jgi:DNA-directed RNA polymerase omega subunit
MSGSPAPFGPAALSDEPASAFDNRFLLVTVAFRRVVQIREGSRPRVLIASHKPTVLAVAEVRAGSVQYAMSEARAPEAA